MSRWRFLRHRCRSRLKVRNRTGGGTEAEWREPSIGLAIAELREKGFSPAARPCKGVLEVDATALDVQLTLRARRRIPNRTASYPSTTCRRPAANASPTAGPSGKAYYNPFQAVSQYVFRISNTHRRTAHPCSVRYLILMAHRGRAPDTLPFRGPRRGDPHD